MVTCSPLKSYPLRHPKRKLDRILSSNCPLFRLFNLLFNFRGEISMKSLIRSIGFVGFRIHGKNSSKGLQPFFDKNPWGFSKRCWWSMLQSRYNHNENLKTQHTPNPGFSCFLGLVWDWIRFLSNSRHLKFAEEKSMISELKALAEQMSKEPLDRLPEIGMIWFFVNFLMNQNDTQWKG